MSIFTKTITAGILLLSLSTGLSFQAEAHIEMTALLTIEHAENGLSVRAALEKEQLAHALKKEGECLPQKMMQVCASEYVTDNIKIIINGKEVTLTKVNQQFTQNSLVINYTTEYKAPIKDIVINSNYMLQYNDHSKVRVLSKLTPKKRMYSLTAQRKSIHISL